METSFDVRLTWYVLRGFLLGTHCTPPTRLYVLPGAPCYLLLFLLLFPSASRICFPMCFFLGASCLLRIAGGGAAPSPLHPPPACISNRRPLRPTPIPLAFSIIIINDVGVACFVRLSCYALQGGGHSSTGFHVVTGAA